MSAKNRLNLDDLLFNIRLGSAEPLYYFGNMLKKPGEGKDTEDKNIQPVFLSQLISLADLKFLVLETNARKAECW